MNLLLGNLFSLLALAADAVSSSRKTAGGVLLVQSLSQFFYAVSSVLLKGYSGAVQNFVSILRNLTALRKNHGKWVEWLLIALGVVLGLVFNNLGAVGLLPIVANLEYSLAVFRFRDNERALKIAFLVCILLFAAFNAAILNIVGLISNGIVLVMTAVFLIRDGKTKERKRRS